MLVFEHDFSRIFFFFFGKILYAHMYSYWPTLIVSYRICMLAKYLHATPSLTYERLYRDINRFRSRKARSWHIQRIDTIMKSQYGLTAVSNHTIMSHAGNHAMYNARLLNIINSLSPMASSVERCVVHFRIIHRFSQNWIYFLGNSFLYLHILLHFLLYTLYWLHMALSHSPAWRNVHRIVMNIEFVSTQNLDLRK